MKALQAYIKQKNWFRLLMKEPAISFPLTANQVQDLALDLRCDLSPENLCCDGELKGAALIKKAAMLNTAQAELKAYADTNGIAVQMRGFAFQ